MIKPEHQIRVEVMAEIEKECDRCCTDNAELRTRLRAHRAKLQSLYDRSKDNPAYDEINNARLNNLNLFLADFPEASEDPDVARYHAAIAEQGDGERPQEGERDE